MTPAFRSLFGIVAGYIPAPPPNDDSTPNNFNFVDQTGAARSSLVESAAITVAGINAPAAITISNGEYQINGGSWVTTSGSVTNGQTVKVRLTTSASYAAGASATLTIGGVSDTFTVTTLDEPVTPTISGTLPDAVRGQPYDASLTVVPDGTAVTLRDEDIAALTALNIVHDGFGRFTSSGIST